MSSTDLDTERHLPDVSLFSNMHRAATCSVMRDRTLPCPVWEEKAALAKICSSLLRNQSANCLIRRIQFSLLSDNLFALQWFKVLYHTRYNKCGIGNPLA